MRVLLLSAEYPPQRGGVGDYTRQLGRALLAQGIEAAVLTGKSEAPPAETPDGDPPALRLVRSWGRRMRADVAAALVDWRADILHIQYQTGAYGMNPAVNLLPTRIDLPTAVTLHDLRMPYLAPKVAPLRRYVTRLLVESAGAVIVTNQEDAARLSGEIASDPDPDIYTLTKPLYPAPVLIPIGSNIARRAGVDRAAVRAGLGVPDDAILLAYFGLISPSKGVATLIEALAQTPPTIQLLIVGGAATTPEDSAHKDQIDQRIAELGLVERIRWTGHVPAEDVSAYLQSADLMALPFADGASYRRGSLLAALGHWLPTITTTPAMTLAPRLRDGREALLVAPGDSAGLAQAILRASQDQQLRERLAQAGGAVAARFNWHEIGAQHRDVYASLCSKR